MCCTGLLKTMMFIFNGVIFFAGAAILAVGIWVQVDSGSLMSILGNIKDAPPGLDQLTNVSYLLIAVGVVLLVIGFLGCCGAVRESRCMLLTFFSIVLIIFIIEVAGAIVLLVFEDLAAALIGGLEDEVRSDIAKNYGNDDKVTDLWNATMEQFKCCGFKNYTDFDSSPFVTKFDAYPLTCCNATELKAGECSMLGAQISLVPGCFTRLVEFIEENAVIVAGVALGIAALEIAAMVVSMILYKDIGQKA
ncbi:tetraspanin 34a [Eucyclogobius newberryi]|uniref:tetraspanin 34a n=1 Tax=Eucyclogobius newberryi TaxID=166745 RepID=UPI003B5C5E9C